MKSEHNLILCLTMREISDNMKFVFFFLLFICFSLIGQSQETFVVVLDTTDIDLRSFSAESLEVYRKDRDYNYGQDPKYEQNFLRRMWIFFLEKLEEVFGEKGTNLFWKIIWYGLAITGLIYFVYFLLKKESAGMFARSEHSHTHPGLDHLSVNVKEFDFDEWIQKAKQEKDFRLAIRLYFLNTLKTLDELEIINWKRFKTNSDYVNELTNQEHLVLFKELIFSYEHAWYGEMEVQEQEFSEIQQDFDAFLSNLNSKQS